MLKPHVIVRNPFGSDTTTSFMVGGPRCLGSYRFNDIQITGLRWRQEHKPLSACEGNSQKLSNGWLKKCLLLSRASRVVVIKNHAAKKSKNKGHTEQMEEKTLRVFRHRA